MFRTRLVVSLLVFAATAGPVRDADADTDEDLAFREREGRREGLLPRPEVEAGRKISLFALRLDALDDSPADPDAPWRITFWRPDSGTVHVLVRAYASRYKMEMRRDASAGVTGWEWPPDLVAACDVSPEELVPLVAFESPGRREYCPAVVHRGRPVADGIRYVFTIVSRVPVTLLDWEIRADGAPAPSLSATERGIAADRPFEIAWAPRQDGDEADPAGEYDFVIRTTLQPQPGTPARKETRKFRFRHRPEVVSEILADE